MNHTPICLTRDDHAKLRLLLTTAMQAKATTSLEKLRDELDRAALFDPVDLPAGVVTIESRVEFEDLGTGEIEEYTIAFPDRANVEKQRISVLAPIGAALIGYREGDVVEWSTPGGMRRLKIHRVTRPELSATHAAPAEQSIAR